MFSESDRGQPDGGPEVSLGGNLSLAVWDRFRQRGRWVVLFIIPASQALGWWSLSVSLVRHIPFKSLRQGLL